MKVLIVDHVKFIRRTLACLIGGHGFETVTAETGAAALQYLLNDPYIHAVVTDLHLPDLCGSEIIEEAKKITRLTDTGIAPTPAFILLTAERNEKVLDSALERGFVQVMRKPPDEAKLIAQLLSIQEDTRDQPPVASANSEAEPQTPLKCPLHQDIPLANDLVAALATIGEAVDALISFDDADGVRRLHKELSPLSQLVEGFLSEHSVRPLPQSQAFAGT